MSNNENKKNTERPPTTKNTWILMIILSFIVMGISIYQMNFGKRASSVDYLIVLLSIIVILSSIYNIFKNKGKNIR